MLHTHVHQVLVVAGFQVDIPLTGQLRVHQHIHAVRLAQSRHGTQFAVLEQAGQVGFVG
ncbi:hypothetical protein D3C77_755170 [compost metagenome]